MSDQKFTVVDGTAYPRLMEDGVEVAASPNIQGLQRLAVLLNEADQQRELNARLIVISGNWQTLHRELQRRIVDAIGVLSSTSAQQAVDAENDSETSSAIWRKVEAAVKKHPYVRQG